MSDCAATRDRVMREPTRMNDASHNTLLRTKSDGHILAVALPIVMAAVLAWWHVSSSAAQASGAQKRSAIESSVDVSIVPGDDFFGYANGGWLKTAVLPADKPRWGARDELEDQARRRVAELLDAASAAPAGSAAAKVADFRTAYLNEAAIESRGIAPIKPLI